MSEKFCSQTKNTQTNKQTKNIIINSSYSSRSKSSTCNSNDIGVHVELHVVILVVSIIIQLSKIFSRCKRSKVRVVETVVVIRKVDIILSKSKNCSRTCGYTTYSYICACSSSCKIKSYCSQQQQQPQLQRILHFDRLPESPPDLLG